jgi:hypothetical protein
MVKLLSYLLKHGGLTYSLVLPQEGSKRKSSDPATAGRPGADDRIRQLTDKKFTSSFKISFSLLKSPTIYFPGQQ